MKKKSTAKPAILAANPKASHDYHILKTFEAGICLKGVEVKSVRMGKVSIKESFGSINQGEIFVYGMHIEPWQTAGSWFQTEAKRPRKLLLHKIEIQKIIAELTQKGTALVCLKVYLKNRRAKLQIALAKGKNISDKRATLKERVEVKEAKRAMQSYNQR